MPQARYHVGILTVSDSVYAQQAVDETGPAIASLLSDSDGDANRWLIAARSFVPDDADQIQGTIKLWTGHRKLDLVLTNGGTGFGQRDVTPEAIQPLLTKNAPGLTMAILTAGLQATPFAALSRPICGVRGNTVIITLPGSPKGALENLSAVLPILPHALELARGTTSSRAAHEAMHGNALPVGPGSSPGALAPTTTSGYASLRIAPHMITSSSTTPSIRPPHSGTIPRSVSPAPPLAHVSRPLNDPVATRPRVSPYPLTPVVDAQDLIRQHSVALAPIRVAPATNIAGAVVAEDVRALESVPAYRASIVDGYAINVTDGATTLPVYDIAALAGAEPCVLPHGHVVRIATGGPVPEGATAVVPVENTKLIKASADNHTEELIEILRVVQPGENIREAGSDMHSGEVILSAGDIISDVGGEVGLMAACGISQLAVYRRPVVGVISTGTEVVDASSEVPLPLGQVRDANRPALLSAIRAAGFESIDFGIVHDHPEQLESTLRSALERVDILITTGGVSMGEADLLKSVLERRMRATIHFGRVLMKPGKPTTFATIPGRSASDPAKLVFSLPGNPVSALVTLHLFALPAARMLGGMPKPYPTKLRVRLTHDLALDARPEFHRAHVEIDEDGVYFCATSTGEQRSSRVASMRGTNALLCLPLSGENGVQKLSKGDVVDALLIGRL